MTAVIEKHLVLYRSDRFFSAFPSIVRLPCGHILLAFRRAPDHRWLLRGDADADLTSVDHVHFRSHIALRRFDSELAAVDDATAMAMHPEASDQDANLFVHSSGRLLQHGFLWYPVTAGVADALISQGRHVLRAERLGAGYLFWGGYVRFSDDMGVNWSDYIELPIDAEGGVAGRPFADGAVALRGRMAELPDGRLVLAGYGAGDNGSKYQQTSLFVSGARGETWQRQPQRLSLDGVGLQEPSLAVWPRGKLSVFHRTTNNADRLVLATSNDGLTFDQPRGTAITGHPYDPLVLPDGRLFLVYGYRHEPMGVRARIGATFTELESAKEIIIRDDSPGADTGYPSACLTEDGRILVAYYIADDTGVRGIEGTLLSYQ